MSDHIPSTRISRMLDNLSTKTGIPKLVITRIIYSAAIVGFTYKKVLQPLMEIVGQRTQKYLLSKMKVGTKNENGDDEAVIAAAHLASKNRQIGSSGNTAISKVFLLRLHQLLKIMLPGLWTVEAGLLGVHTMTLIARTLISIHVALLEGNYLLNFFLLILFKQSKVIIHIATME